jgi:hypothetical protein
MIGVRLILTGVLVAAMNFVAAQNYSSVTDGSWTTAADWSNTSGWGTVTPPLDGSQGSGTITMQNTMTISGNYTTGSPTLNILAGKTLTITGNMIITGGATINVAGTLTISGTLTLNSTLNILPGGSVIVTGNTTVVNSNYLIVGTTATPPPYASFVEYNNLVSTSSGDITLNKNARVAVFGSVTDDGSGGTTLQLNNGAQLYVGGNIAFSGGNDKINNANSTNPFGLYVNGTTTNTGGGHTTTTNEGNKAAMQTTDPSLYSWVAGLPGSSLPVTLLYFRAGEVSATGIELNWATATEKNFDHFDVEKSTDGQSFSLVATVQGHGTTTVEHDYAWTDTDPFAGNSYYRLTSVDFDGATESFPLVAVDLQTQKTISVYPNPVTEEGMHIVLNFEPSQATTATLSDLSGNLRQTFSFPENHFLAPVSVPSGLYILKIRNGLLTYTERIIVK